MRNIIGGAAATVLCLLAVAPSAQAAGSIRWRKTWAAAISEAKRTHKLIMVDFYTDWCGWCKRLDKDTYTSPNVVKMSEQFIPIKLNAEKEGTAQARQYRVEGFPAILFVNGNGAVENKIGGYLPPAPFAAAMTRANMMHQQLPKLEAATRAHPTDEKSVATLAMLYVQQGDANRALPMIGRVEKLDPSNSKGHLAKLYNAAGDRFQEAQHFEQAVPWFRKAARVGKTPQDIAYSRVSLASCLLSQNKLREALPEVKATLAVSQCPPQIRDGAQKMLTYLNSKNVR